MNGLHVLTLGVDKFVQPARLDVLYKEVVDCGGMLVLAHPRRYKDFDSDLLNRFNGVEVWNTSYDGKIFPPGRNIRLLIENRKGNKDLFAFGG